MITFTFYCPACEQVANAKADPVDLLFVSMGRTGLQVECENCATNFSAIVSNDKFSLGAELPKEDEPSASE